MKINFSEKATLRLESIASYIYKETKSKKITVDYLKSLKTFIVSTLTLYPKAGRPFDEIYSKTRKLVYQSYSIIYRISKDQSRIDILTIYRENLP
jgi:plasmid stabilization system protein ParE